MVLDSTVVFNELSYHPATSGETEWIELYNQMAVDMDLSAWSIRGADFTFPLNTTLPGRSYLVIARDPHLLRQQTGLTNVFGPFLGRLDDSGETLQLINRGGRVMDTITYDDQNPWPDGADGGGATLAKKDPGTSSVEASNWTTSWEPVGTPGQENFPVLTTEPRVTALVARDASWQYATSTTPVPSNWNVLDANLTNWNSGEAVLFAGQFSGIAKPSPTLHTGSSPIVQNPSFEANTNGSVGYGSVAQWNALGGTGINPATDGNAPFADNGKIPDGKRIAFIQGPGSISQTISGMVAGQDYWLELHYNARGCCNALPSISVSLSGQVLIAPTPVEPIGGIGEPYYTAMVPFRATATSGSLLIRNVATVGDHSLLIDSVTITPRHVNDLPLKNGSFEASGIVTPSPGYITSKAIAGWTYRGTGQLGVAAAGSPMLDNGQPADGQAVVFLENSGVLEQTITGLTPGNRYELKLSANARAATAAAQLRVTVNQRVLLEEEIAAVGVGADFQMRSMVFTATSESATIAIEQTREQSVLLIDRVTLTDLKSPLATELASVTNATYFRHTFEYQGDPARTELTLRHFIDDGAVFYLNGQRWTSVNMPDDPPTSATRALRTVNDPSWSEAVELPGDLLVPGTNVLAIEVHQAQANDTDMAFGVELTASESPLPPGSSRVTLQLSEISGASDASYTVELRNVGSTPVHLDEAGLLVDGSIVPLPGRTMAAGEYLTIDVARPLRSGDLIVLQDRSRQQLLDATHATQHAQARMADGSDDFFQATSLTPSARNVVPLEDDVVINEIMYHHSPHYADPGVPPTYTRSTVLPLDGIWRYNESGEALPVDWYNRSHFVGGNWQQGSGLFGFETGAVIAPGLKTRWQGPGIVAYYLETEFQVAADQLNDHIRWELRYAMDDGVIIWINGQELVREHLPDVNVTSSTLATRSVNNAELTEYLQIPSSMLVSGSNRISVQLHQSAASSSDVIFGAEVVQASPLDSGTPATPFRENELEWIELYNRGDRVIDLSNWSLANAVDFTFPSGTQLGPRQHLVVSSNAIELSRLYPTISIAGTWAGTLSNSDERIELRDHFQNRVDEVHYFDGGRWNHRADGEGSSLELIDPNANNNLPENWAVSDTLGQSTWQTFRFRATATHPNNLIVPDLFDEMIVGLLDTGEVWLDDFHLVEDPDHLKIERLQNGSFEEDTIGSPAAHWRWIGNHGETVVDVDPTDPSNRLLRLIASGPTEHMHNHGETTLADEASIAVGSTYEFSFRARWVSGSPQLNTRLYFARAAVTTILELPEHLGTPGLANSSQRDNGAPLMDQLHHSPLVPKPNQPVDVELQVEDPDGIASVQLHYAVNGGDFVDVVMNPMNASQPAIYRGTIPGQPNDAVIQFYVTSQDRLGASSHFPAAGAQSRALYTVAMPLDVPEVHTMRLIMTRSDSTALHAPTNVMSNGRTGATLIMNDREVYYDVGVRLRASGYGRQGGLAGFNIQFDPHQLFRGVHQTISLDRGSVFSSGTGAGGVQGVPGASPHELLIYQIAHRATGIAAMYDDVVYVDAPRSTNTGMALLKMARYTDAYLDNQFDEGGDGSLFKFELIYHSTGTSGGSREGLKLPPTAVAANDIANYGDDSEAYRFNFTLKNNTAADDYSSIIQLGRAFSLTGAALETAAAEIIDVDQWMRTFALISLVGTADTYNMGLAHNLELYVRPADGKVLAFPWDMDHGFYHSTRANILGQGGSNLAKVIARPIYQRLFYKHLLDIVQNAYNATTVSPWASHYTDITGHGNAQFFIDYVTQRSAYVLERLAAVAPQLPFQITTNAGNPLVVDSATAVVEGQGWIDVDQIFLAGHESPLPVLWKDNRTWQVEVPLRPGGNTIELTAKNFRGDAVGTGTLSITSNEGSTLAERFLRVTEVMYHPAEPNAAELLLNPAWTEDDFEFIELTNLSVATPLSLQGVRFTDGPADILTLNAATPSIRPGERAVVVSNRAAFVARYGDQATILGEYSGNLRNSGERIRFEDGLGRTIVDFTYSDAAPWPSEADGSGRSLDLLDAQTPVTQLGQAQRWMASIKSLGSPGTAPATSGDINRDGAVTPLDIDLVCRALIDGNQDFELDGVGTFDENDVDFLVEQMLRTSAGDVDLNGSFNSSDLVRVFQEGLYEDHLLKNAKWSSGDWNCDGEFTSADLVKAFQSGSFLAAASEVVRRL